MVTLELVIPLLHLTKLNGLQLFWDVKKNSQVSTHHHLVDSVDNVVHLISGDEAVVVYIV